MMKKNTLMRAMLLSIVSLTSFAQTTIIDRPLNEDASTISTKRIDGELFVAADSFVLTEEIAIGEIDVPGKLRSNIGYLGTLEIGFNIYIYEDDNGVPAGDPTQPGTGIVELSDIDPVYYTKYENGLPFYNRTDFNQIQVTAANGGEQIVLQPGTYWISFFLTADEGGGGPGPNDAGRWAWLGSTTPNPFPPIEPVLIDPFDLYEAGYTNWTNITNVAGGLFPSFAWTLRSEDIQLGTRDELASQIAVYPNPSTTIVYVSIPDTIKVYQSNLRDVTGKTIGGIQLINGSIDISSLSKGIYLLHIDTSEGTLIKKVIKS